MTSSINIGQDKTLNKSSSFNRTVMVFISYSSHNSACFTTCRGTNKTFLCSAYNFFDLNQLAFNGFQEGFTPSTGVDNWSDAFVSYFIEKNPPLTMDHSI